MYRDLTLSVLKNLATVGKSSGAMWLARLDLREIANVRASSVETAYRVVVQIRWLRSRIVVCRLISGVDKPLWLSMSQDTGWQTKSVKSNFMSSPESAECFPSRHHRLRRVAWECRACAVDITVHSRATAPKTLRTSLLWHVSPRSDVGKKNPKH